MDKIVAYQFTGLILTNGRTEAYVRRDTEWNPAASETARIVYRCEKCGQEYILAEHDCPKRAV
jgi:hypothetical protein